MFKKLFKKIYNPKTDKQRILETIHEQNILINKFQDYKANSEESLELININIEQLLENINDLSLAFSELLLPLKNKDLCLKEYIELLKYEVPKNCSGFCVKIDSVLDRIDTRYKFPAATYHSLDQKNDKENYRTKVKLLMSNKLTSKFERLYFKKLEQKIGETLKKFDEKGFQYIEANEYDLLTQINLIEFQIAIIKAFNNPKHLLFGLVKEEFGGLWDYLSHCSNLPAVFIFTKKQDIDKIIKGIKK